MAALPLLAGMGPDAYRDAGQFGATFRRAMPMCAGALVVAALIGWFAVRKETGAGGEAAGEAEGEGPAPAESPTCRPECVYHCGVTAPPLDPGSVSE